METVPALVQEVTRRHRDKVALRKGESVLTYGQLDDCSNQLAALLLKTGLRPGKHVGMIMRDSPEYVIGLLGLWKAGYVPTPFSHMLKERELERSLDFCQSELVLCDADEYAGVGARSIVRVTQSGIHAFGEEAPWEQGTDLTDAGPGKEQTALLVHTSGTTSDPKAVQLSHGNLYHNIRGIIQYLGLTAEDRILCTLPFHYVYGNSVLLTHLCVGAELVFGSSMMYPQAVVNELEAFGITGFSGVASTYHVLSSRTDWSRRSFPSLRYLTQAGGPMPYPWIERLLDTMQKKVAFFVMYGQTEASARLTYLPPSRLKDKKGSVGIPVDGVELKILDDRGSEQPPGKTGEVCARGKNVMKGYWNNPEATGRTLKDGWLHTGDLGYLDEEGFLYLQSRKSDMIKTGAHRVNPNELEELIGELSGIGPVCVLGVKDEFLGERIRVVVEGVEDRLLTRRIMRHCKENLPNYKMPAEIVWVDEIPRTRSGKIQRALLKEME